MNSILHSIETHYGKWMIVTLCVGAIVRLTSLVLLQDVFLPDAGAYRAAGASLMTTGDIGNPLAMPLYPVWSYLTGGGLGTLLADIAVSVITIWLIADFTRLLGGDKVAMWLAAVATSLYPHFVFYSATGLTETVYLFFVVLSFRCLYLGQFLKFSCIVVLSILLRPTLDLLAPLLIIISALIIHQHTYRQTMQKIVLYGVVYCVLMTPWWIHNFHKYDTFVRLSLGDGVVLYAGNNPLNKTGGGVIEPEQGIVDVDFSGFKHLTDPIERNAALKAAAIDYIQENPVRFFELSLVKFQRFWRLWPFAPEYQKPLVILVSLLTYGLGLVLALFHLAKYLVVRWRLYAPILIFAMYLTAVHMVTIGSIRYRLPLEPFVIIFAALQIGQIFKRLNWDTSQKTQAS